MRTRGRLHGLASKLMAAMALCAPVAIGTTILVPKDPGYAAPGRLGLTILVFAAAMAGLASFSGLRRRMRDRGMMHRYGGASSAVRDTLSYLRNEQQLAGRGQLLTVLVSLLAFELYILAHWPQVSVLAPWQTMLGWIGVGGIATLPMLLLRHRGHLINTWFLRRYLHQQIDHLGYRTPRRVRRQQGARENFVTVTGFGRFNIGGFAWSFDDLMKNVLVLGQTGSGKTGCVLANLLDGLIASTRGDARKISGLVIDAKGDFHRKLMSICVRLGRRDDLVCLDPSAWAEMGRTLRSIAWNALDNADDALEIATRLIAALRLIGLELGNEGSFFLDSAKVFLRHAIVLVRAGILGGPPSLVDVYRLAQESEDETPFYHQLLKAISARFPDAVPQEILDAIAYFEREWRCMADRQKSAVQGTLTQLLDEFLVAPFRDIFAGHCTISIADIIDRGMILYVNMPAADRERMSRIINTLVKLEFQRQILLRPRKTRPSFFLCDEFQTFYTSGEGRGDSDFFERSRESNHANIVASQNIEAFLKKTRNPHDVKNLLGNCATKIFLRNGDPETNLMASALFGQRSEIVITCNEQAAVDGGWRRRHTSYGRATRTLPRVPQEAFTQLAIPVKGDTARQHAETIVHLGSRGETEHHILVWPFNPLE